MSVPMIIEQLNKQDKDKTLHIRMNGNNLSIYKVEWEVDRFPIGMRLDFNGKIDECTSGSVIIGSFGIVSWFKKSIIVVNVLFFMVTVLALFGNNNFTVDIFVFGMAQLIFAWSFEKVYIFVAHHFLKKQEEAIIKFLESFGDWV